MKVIKSLFVITLVAFSIPVQARWATVEDVPTSVESFSRDIYVRKDGTYTETIGIMIKPTKESGKDSLVSFPLVYNAGFTEQKILEAKTIQNAKEYPVDLKHIEDKPLASSPKGFDQKNQVLIAFPHMSLESKAYIKYQITAKEAPIPGFFSTDFIYGHEHWQTSKVHVVSELPFHIKAHDPEQFLDIKQTQSDGKYVMDIVLKKPIIKVPVEEQFIATNGTLYPWVTISTLNEWPQLGALMVTKYESVVNQPLPEFFQAIVKEAATKTTPIEKINTVTALLSEKVTYMGDWRTIKGAFVPRNLSEIADSKLGDCKDFSAVTTAILRQLGLKANMALVYRGVETYEFPNDIPNPNIFNHAFLRVQENEKIYWVDPTNFSSYAQGIYPDIAERQAFILDPLKPTFTRTPNINLSDSQIYVVKKITLPNTESGITEVLGQILMKGVQALPFIGADLQASKEMINTAIISMVSDENRAVSWKVNDYNLKSRIAQDVDFQFNLSQKHQEMKTTSGKAFLLSYQSLVIPKLLTKTNDRVSDLYLELPGIYRREILLRQAQLIGKEFSNCTVESPWFTGSRNIKDTPEGINVLDELIVKKNKILNSELKSEEYTQFQNKVYACFGDTALVFKHSPEL